MSAHDLSPESTWEFHRVDLPFSPAFYTSSVHYDWIMAEEQHILQDVIATVKKNGRCGIALDVGMNDGFYSMLFAALGCQVHAFEIQPRCIEVATSVALKNNFTARIKVFESPVTANVGEVVSIPMGKHSIGTCDGGFSMHIANPGKSAHLPFNQIGERHLRGTQLDELYLSTPTEISYMKVDTEGHEFDVFQGSVSLFRERKIAKMVFEASSQLWDDSDRAKITILDEIIGYGYALKCSLSQETIPSSRLLDRPEGCGIDIYLERTEHHRDTVLKQADSLMRNKQAMNDLHDGSYRATNALNYIPFFLLFLVITSSLMKWARKVRTAK